MALHDKVFQKLQSLFPNDKIELGESEFLEGVCPRDILEVRPLIINGEKRTIRFPIWDDATWQAECQSIPTWMDYLALIYHELSTDKNAVLPPIDSL